MMGGVVEVESNPEKGSLFRISFSRLEVRRETADGKAIGHEEDEAVVFEPAVVIVADDIACNRELIECFLAPFPFALIFASNGGEVLTHLRTRRIDLVLTDIRMPEMDGLALLEKIRSRESGFGNPPVVAITASAMREESEKLAGLFDGYLAKPLSRKRLVAELKRFLPHRIEEGNAPTPNPPSKKERDACSDRARTRLPEIVSRLESEFVPEWKDLLEACYIDDIEDFASRLEKFSEEFDIDLLADWSRLLHEQARCSDTAGIEKSMGGFEEIVGRLAEENRAGFIPARR